MTDRIVNEFYIHDDLNYEYNDEKGNLRFELHFDEDFSAEPDEYDSDGFDNGSKPQKDGDVVEYFISAALNGICWLMFDGTTDSLDAITTLKVAIKNENAKVQFTDRTKNIISLSFPGIQKQHTILLTNHDRDTLDKLEQYAKECRITTLEKENADLKNKLTEMELENKRLIELLASKPLI